LARRQIEPPQIDNPEAAAQRVAEALVGLMTVHRAALDPRAITFYGLLNGDSGTIFRQILSRLSAIGYVPFLHGTGFPREWAGEGERDRGPRNAGNERVALRVQRMGARNEREPSALVNIVLFLLTLLTTLAAGSTQRGGNPLSDPLSLFLGIPFSFTLLSILSAHELGHYFVSRRNGVAATLPFFIPNPIPLIGTFGAVIRVKSSIPSRRALVRIGAAGPICGMLVALPALVIGLKLSRAIPLSAGGNLVYLGDSVLLSILERVLLGPLPAGYDIMLHPVAFAGWIGCLVTSMNLLPMGQLDGGHIAYAVLGAGQRVVATLAFLLIAALGFLWQGWFIWAVVIPFLGLRHPPPLDDYTRLDSRGTFIAFVAALLLVLTFMPVPMTI
jgi:membrane-associated protease RseP (regulator of RpoE activity)